MTPSPYAIPGIRPEDLVFVRTEPIEFYKKRVSEFYGVPIEKLMKKTRKREVVMARQIAMYLAKKHGKFTLKAIGESFGGRDHTTVIHSKDTVKDLIDTDDAYRERLEYLEDHLYEGATVGVFKVA